MRSFSSSKSGETSSPASKSGSQAPAARAGAALQRMAGPEGASSSAGRLMQLQSAIGNRAVLQLLASGGERRMLPDPKDIRPPAQPQASSGSEAPIQRIRSELGEVYQEGASVTPQELKAYLDLVEQQIQELHEGETARTETLDEWKKSFIAEAKKMMRAIQKEGVQDLAGYSISTQATEGGDTAILKAFRQAVALLQSMREELNTSLEVYHSMLETQSQMNGYKEERKQASYKEPERAETITEWDDRFAYLYRRMSVDEYSAIGKANEKKKLEKVTADNNSRKWLSTSNAHSFAFKNDDVVHSGAEVKEVIVRFKVAKQGLMEILAKSFPAYKSDSYKNKNKDKVLIHQELLAQGKNASTGTDEALKTIFENNEHFNIGFSLQTIQLLDPVIVDITATPVE